MTCLRNVVGEDLCPYAEVNLPGNLQNKVGRLQSRFSFRGTLSQCWHDSVNEISKQRQYAAGLFNISNLI